MIKPCITWNQFLMKHLLDPEEALNYLQVYLQGYLDDGDKPFFLNGLENVVMSHGGIDSVSEKYGIDVKVMSDIINNKSMPAFDILNSIITHFKNLCDIDTNLSDQIPYYRLSTKPQAQITSQKRYKPKDITTRQQQNITYWSNMSKYIDDKNDWIRMTTNSTRNFYNFQLGLKGFSIRLNQSIQHKRIGTYIVVRGNNLLRNFYYLRLDQENIERDFGNSLNWHSRPKYEKRIGFNKQDVDPSDLKDWENQYKWMINMSEKLHAVFYPRLEKLNV